MYCPSYETPDETKTVRPTECVLLRWLDTGTHKSPIYVLYCATLFLTPARGARVKKVTSFILLDCNISRIVITILYKFHVSDSQHFTSWILNSMSDQDIIFTLKTVVCNNEFLANMRTSISQSCCWDSTRVPLITHIPHFVEYSWEWASIQQPNGPNKNQSEFAV